MPIPRPPPQHRYQHDRLLRGQFPQAGQCIEWHRLPGERHDPSRQIRLKPPKNPLGRIHQPRVVGRCLPRLADRVDQRVRQRRLQRPQRVLLKVRGPDPAKIEIEPPQPQIHPFRDQRVEHPLQHPRHELPAEGLDPRPQRMCQIDIRDVGADVQPANDMCAIHRTKRRRHTQSPRKSC